MELPRISAVPVLGLNLFLIFAYLFERQKEKKKERQRDKKRDIGKEIET